MNQLELGDKYIKLGKLLKNPNAKLKDLVGAAFDCGLIYNFNLVPNPEDSVDLICEIPKDTIAGNPSEIKDNRYPPKGPNK